MGPSGAAPRSAVLRYGAAVALVSAALAVSLLLRPLVSYTVLIFFFAALFAASWVGGRGPMALATVLGAVLAQIYMFPPVGVFEPTAPSLFSLLVFLSVAAFADAILTRLRTARDMAHGQALDAARHAEQVAQQATELEEQVAESEVLAEELEETNAALNEAQEELRRSAKRSERLQAVTAEFSRAATVTAVADAVVRSAVAAMDGVAGVFATRAPEAMEARIIRMHNFGPAVADRWRTVSLDAKLPLTDALRTGREVWVASREEMAEHYPDLADLGSRHAAWVALPIHADGRVAAVLGVSFERAGRFSPEDRGFMRTLADQCGQALERARAFDAERDARVRLEFAERRVALLAEVSGRLSATLDQAEALSRLAGLVVPDLADGCLVHLLTEDGNPAEPVLAVAAHRDAATAEALRALEERWRGGTGRLLGCDRVVGVGEPELAEVVTDNHLRERALDAEHLDALLAVGIRSYLCVPITLQDRLLGSVALLSGERGRFTDSDLGLARAMAGRAGQAIENARLFQGMQAANQAKADFLAVMSHELRTPLNAVIGFADLLLLGVPTELAVESQHQVERIRVAAGHLLQLVEEVLGYSRMEAGKEEVRAVSTHLGRLVRETVGVIEPLARDQGLELDVALPAHGPEVLTDPTKVRQILTNLLSNAVKFTEAGSVHVALRIDAARVEVVVRDTGIGIAAEDLQHIFEPFWQAERGTTRRFGGTGLGLGVARRMARLLGGDLTVDSTVGRGSTCTLRLPVDGPGNGST